MGTGKLTSAKHIIFKLFVPGQVKIQTSNRKALRGTTSGGGSGGGQSAGSIYYEPDSGDDWDEDDPDEDLNIWEEKQIVPYELRDHHFRSLDEQLVIESGRSVMPTVKYWKKV